MRLFKTHLLILFIGIFTLFGCQKSSLSEKTSYIGTWEFVEIADGNNGATQEIHADGGGSLVITEDQFIYRESGTEDLVSTWELVGDGQAFRLSLINYPNEYYDWEITKKTNSKLWIIPNGEWDASTPFKYKK